MQQVYSATPPKDLINQPKLNFIGSGGTYFGILIVNALLCMVTLGLYYPWAKAKKLDYLYSSTELEKSGFTWSGTGNEMFKGFIKAIGLIIALVVLNITLASLVHKAVGAIVYFVGIMVIIPLAIHGSLRYRFSRTSWRGIRFGYRGDRNVFFKMFLKEMFLTIITAGIYGSWMIMKIRNYVIGNLKFGSAEFSYKGDGWEFFVLNIKGYFLTLITLGIYGFWWQADLFKYYIDNLKMVHGDKSYNFRSTATGGKFAGVLILNLIIIIFTLGFGFAWAQINLFKFIAENIAIDGDIQLEELSQTEEEYSNAMGEDLVDFLDISII
ncbi:DUF898 family protein [Chitinophaga silvatica]|uniref:DUF898 family protein n=1 Tax=Chitinophaga silvatica TaxID=2282649 RepID=A0A3E1YA49_9BACT|nr:DUF898 family protein [Chitinophaga silvatica]RFS22066.1 DUF898 family protein [Chitinophaga silvatica]